MTPSARDQISEMTEITERTLATLYRDCPTAFWLAPDGDGALPQTDGPSLPERANVALAEPHADPVTDHPAGVEGRAGAMAVSMMAAGPIFLASMMLMIEGGRESIGERTMMAVVGTMISLPFTVIIGAIFGLAPIAAGVTALARLGVHDPVARNRWLWAATGAGMGLAIAGMFDAQIVTIPLVLTSVACAMIAHRAISWHDPEPA